MKNARELESIPDDELLRRLSDLLRQSRRTEADLAAHIQRASPNQRAVPRPAPRPASPESGRADPSWSWTVRRRLANSVRTELRESACRR
jgi:hypothetical protein